MAIALEVTYTEFLEHSHPLNSPVVVRVRNPFYRKADQWERGLLWTLTVNLALLMSIFLSLAPYPCNSLSIVS